MIKRRLATKVFGSAFLMTLLVPAVAFAEAAAEAAGPWQAQVGSAIAAGFAMGVSALAAGYAQAKIGAAGAGTLAERPEAAIWIITLQALPEIIVLLGFVSAIIIAG
jgi:V/A-type H+/Na+-transporting ATPase subunit K